MSSTTTTAATTGIAYAITDTQRLQRFLILGCEVGTFHVTEPALAVENATAISRLLAAGHGAAVVEAIVRVSTEWRAAKQGPTMFALAMCARLGDVETRRAAYHSLTRVCRIPTHLFQFISMTEQLGAGSGWGRLSRRAISEFYHCRASSLAYMVTKYKNREGWTHRDVLRKAHVKPATPATAAVLRYAAKGWGEDGSHIRKLLDEEEAKRRQQGTGVR